MINAKHTDMVRIEFDVPNGRAVTLTGKEWLTIYYKTTGATTMGHTGTGPFNTSNDKSGYRYWPETPVVLQQRLEQVIRIFHKYCDPVDMTYEDHLVWEEWNKKFHPENYDEANV